MVSLQLGNHLVASLQPRNSVVHELVHNSLCGLLLVYNSGALAHEVRSILVHHIFIIIVVVIARALGKLVEIGLVRDDTLGNKLLDLGLAVGLPIVDVVVVAHAHGTAGPDDSADVIVVAGCAHSFLVGLWCAGLVGEDEAGSDPDGTGAHHKRGSEELAVVNTTGSNNLDGAAGKRRLVLLANVDDSGDEDSRGNIASVATALTTLGADDVDAEVNALLDVLNVADHVHVDDAIGVELVDDGLRGHTDGRDKKLGALLNDNVDELVELTLCVIVAVQALS